MPCTREQTKRLFKPHNFLSRSLCGDPDEARLVLAFVLLQALSCVPDPCDPTVTLDECATPALRGLWDFLTQSCTAPLTKMFLSSHMGAKCVVGRIIEVCGI